MRPRQRAKVEWWVLFAGFAAFVLFCGFGVLVFFGSVIDRGNDVGFGLLIAWFAGAVAVLFASSNSPANHRRRYRKRLRAWMRTRSDCPWCGYELAGSGGKRCPECGKGWGKLGDWA